LAAITACLPKRSLIEKLGLLSEGNLTVRLPSAQDPEFAEVSLRFNATLERLDGLVQSINEVSLSLAGEAGDIATNAQNLADRGESQAATLEESSKSSTRSRFRQTYWP